MNKSGNLSLSVIVMGMLVIVVCLVVTVLIVRGGSIASEGSTSEFEDHQQNLDECIASGKPCVDLITGEKDDSRGATS